MRSFVKKTGCKGFIGNYPASGAAIIEQFNEEHKTTGHPIIYTSADSVFQIACNLDIVPIETLYKWCEIARGLLDHGYNTSRVIARPYMETADGLQRVSALRKDYSVVPTKPTLLNRVQEQNGRVIAVGKIEDIFVGSGVTHAVHTVTNKEGLELTLKVLKRDLDLDKISIADSVNSSVERELVFVNLVDTDMLFGHRNDAASYGKSLEEIDRYMEEILPMISDDDLLIITADHGCDPTQPGTDHTREMVPILSYNKTQQSIALGTKPSFIYIAQLSTRWLGMQQELAWA